MLFRKCSNQSKFQNRMTYRNTLKTGYYYYTQLSTVILGTKKHVYITCYYYTHTFPSYPIFFVVIIVYLMSCAHKLLTSNGMKSFGQPICCSFSFNRKLNFASCCVLICSSKTYLSAVPLHLQVSFDFYFFLWKKLLM